MYAPAPPMSPMMPMGNMTPMGPPMMPMGNMAPMPPMQMQMQMVPVAPVMMAPPPPVYYPPPPPPPPVYYPPPPPPQQAQQTIIITGGNDNDNGSACRTCGRDTGNVMRKKLGCVGITWCICLALTTGFACYLPLTRDDCKDTQILCNRCQTLKNTVPANFC